MPTIQVRDTTLYYECIGQGQPLLLIHGLGASTREWEQQVAFFASSYRVITVDLRGHGQSGKPPGPYCITLFASDIAALLEYLGDHPAAVVGHSLGGMVAFELALNTPHLTRGLVIVNSGPEIPRGNLKERLRLLLGWLQRQFIIRVMGMRKMGQVLSQRLFPNPEQTELRQAMVEQWAANERRAYLSALDAVRRWPGVADRLDLIQCPTLVITADQDYTPVSFKQAYVARMPQAKLAIIANSRHMTPQDRPAEFNAVLLEFLRQI